MTVTCTRVLEFDAGHRLLKHEGKCRHVHGHRYRVELTCQATCLDEVGRVIDFGVVKAVVGGWIDENLDHGFIAQHGDPVADHLRELGSKLYMVPFSPTSENLARFVGERATGLLSPHGVEVTAVKLWETPNCYSTWSKEES